jgi:hypothetical protein
MKTFLISIFSSALVLGVAAAQDSATPQPASPSSEAQTAAPAQPPTQQTAPATSTQSPQPQAPQAGATPAPAGAPKRIAPGSVLPVSLTKTIDAKKAKTGDEVVAKVTQDMKTTSGEVLVPKDTKVVGHVTEAQARSKEQKESQVGIAFDRAVMKDGGEMQMPMSIQAIIGPQNQNNQDNAGGGNGSGSAPAPGSGGNSGTGRASGMAGSAPAPTTSPSSGAGNSPTDAQEGTNARPPITAQTQGVVGISDLKLTNSAPSANEGSVVSSEKNNVKLESGTLMLLRVNQ